jgi:uncharacterized protein (DUF2164 family)
MGSFGLRPGQPREPSPTVTPVNITPDTRQRLIVAVKRFVDEELDQEIGDLKASVLLDRVLEEVAPTVYNQAVADVQRHLASIMHDLDSTCFMPEPDPRGSRSFR